MSEPKTTSTSSRVMDLRQLIAAPLVATVEADALSTKKYLDHLFSVGFEPDETYPDRPGKMKYVTFSYREQGKEKTISLPLMSLIPLPLLQVKEAEFDFDINIIDAITSQEEKSFSLVEGEVNESDEEESAFSLRASLSPSSGSGKSGSSSNQSMSANMKVKISMQQADVPGGLTNLLHLTNNSVQFNENHEDLPLS